MIKYALMLQVGSEAACALQDIRLVISYLKIFGVKEQVYIDMHMYTSMFRGFMFTLLVKMCDWIIIIIHQHCEKTPNMICFSMYLYMYEPPYCFSVQIYHNGVSPLK